MNDLVEAKHTTLPTLIDRATAALAAAKTSAEVLEARDAARLAYDVAKSTGRMARAKDAHDEIIAAVYRAQADALLIEARAKIRLADEYDAAQERGEVQRHGGQTPRDVGGSNIPTTADLGLRRDEIHEARKLRDAEATEPGKVERTLGEMVERGEEPTKAKLKREIVPASEPAADAPDAKARREIARLTTDGMIDEIIGLRADLEEAKSKANALKAENADLKASLKEATASDQGAVIGSLQQQLRAVKKARDDAMSATKRIEYKMKALEKRVKELEAMPISMDAA